MPNLEALLNIENFHSPNTNNKNNLFLEVLQVLNPDSASNYFTTQILELAGYTETDKTSKTLFLGHNIRKHARELAHKLVTVIFNVKLALKNKSISIELKKDFIHQFLSEFGNVETGDFIPAIVYLSKKEDIEAAEVAFKKAIILIKNDNYGAVIFQSMIELLNIITNNLKAIESGIYYDWNFLDMVEVMLFNQDEPILSLMNDQKYKHKQVIFDLSINIFNTSPYFLFLNISDKGINRAYNLVDAHALYLLKFEGQLTDSADVRLKRLNTFNHLNLIYGTLDTVEPSVKPKKHNKNTEYFKKRNRNKKLKKAS
ncbi:TPA: hypothetical protein ACGIK9_002804 [Acinetobacter baumannii]|uniref:hypothetical protein n=1 Tax=Acinetobacter baumannii TaxID=470 RepID=UPI00338DB5B4